MGWLLCEDVIEVIVVDSFIYIKSGRDFPMMSFISHLPEPVNTFYLQFTTMMRNYATKPQVRFKPTACGTNSPPLEATGEEKPMGRASVDREYDAGFISDLEQRKGALDGLFYIPSGPNNILCFAEYFKEAASWPALKF